MINLNPKLLRSNHPLHVEKDGSFTVSTWHDNAVIRVRTAKDGVDIKIDADKKIDWRFLKSPTPVQTFAEALATATLPWDRMGVVEILFDQQAEEEKRQHI